MNIDVYSSGRNMSLGQRSYKWIYQIKEYDHLKNEYERNAKSEFGMPDFVVEKIHSCPYSETSPQNGEQEKTGFGDPPFISFGFLLVRTEQNKC